MKDIPHVWQQSDYDKSFVFSLNEKLTNEFCFLVQGCKQERAEQIATLACAAPLLLEALEVMTDLVRIKYGNLDADVYAEIKKSEALIKSAKGE